MTVLNPMIASVLRWRIMFVTHINVVFSQMNADSVSQFRNYIWFTGLLNELKQFLMFGGQMNNGDLDPGLNLLLIPK